MIRKFLASLFLSLSAVSITLAQDMVITGVIDGPLSGGTPKAIELCVLNDIPDLSIYGVGSANNGGGSDGEEFTFPAVAASAGTFIHVASESPQFQAFFGFAPAYTSGAMSINGDDAIFVERGGRLFITEARFMSVQHLRQVIDKICLLYTSLSPRDA